VCSGISGFAAGCEASGFMQHRKQDAAPPTMNAVKQIVYSCSPTDIV
jgi:hypothetical protein